MPGRSTESTESVGTLWGVSFFKGLRLSRDAGLSPQRTRGVPANGEKPGATLRLWSAGVAERAPWRTFVRLKQMRRWRDELAATEDGERFMPQKARGDGRRSSDEEKRDSSLRGPARKQRATLRWCSGRAAEDGERFRHGMGRRPSLRRNDGQKQGEKQVPLYARDDRKGSARSSIGS
jgi:hypothetical protein